MAARKRKGATSSQAKAPRKRAPRASKAPRRKRAAQEKPSKGGAPRKRRVASAKSPAKAKPPTASRARKKVAATKPRKKVAPRKPSKKQRERARREDRRFQREAERALAEERRLRRNELAKNRRRRKRAEAKGDELGYLRAILDDMSNRSPVPLSLTFTEAEVGARTPWLIVGRFDPQTEIGYADLFEVFRSWADDLLLEARIHPQRMSQIRVVYEDPKAKRGESDSIVSHEGPWEAVISELAGEVNPDDEDSLANRYEDTTVPQFYVYFSSDIVSSLSDDSIFTY